MTVGPIRRIAVNAGGGYVPGLNTVAAGVVLAAREQGWEVAGIHDGYEGLLFRDRYADGGLVPLDGGMVDGLLDAVNLGTGRVNPFTVRTVTAGCVEEVDRSGQLLATLREEGIDAVVSVAGRRQMSVVWKLERRGLPTICVPVSVENDVAATGLAFGYNSTLQLAIDLVSRIRCSALTERRVAVVEILGQHSGWLALQSGIAALADAVLLPEIPYDLAMVARHLTAERARRPALVVVAEGAQPAVTTEPAGVAEDDALESTRRALSPGSSREGTVGGRRVIDRSGAAGETVALGLQRLSRLECYPVVLDELLRVTRISAVDLQAGLAYGAAAVRGLAEGFSGVLVAVQPPRITFVPLGDAVNAVRPVPPESEFVLTVRSLGMSLGD